MNVFDLAAVLTLDTSDYDKGLDKASDGAADMKKGLADAGKTIAKTAVGLGAIGGAAFGFANKIASTGDNIDKMSQKVGFSTKAYQEWDYVLNIAGTEMSSMTTGLKTLTNKFDEATSGSASAIETFEALGLSMEDIQDLSREELFGTVISAFQDMEDSTKRAALANDLFGKSGQELTPLFNTTQEETKELIQQVNDLGGIMSEEAVKDSADFKDSMTSLKAAFSGAAAGLAKDLVPAVKGLVDKITNFIKSGGLQKMLDIFKKLKPVIIAVTAAIVAYKTAMAIGSAISAVTTAVKGFSAAQAALNVVLNANPIGAIILGITALIAAITLLWNNCEGFREAVTNILGFISELFSSAVEGIRTAFEAAWNGIKAIWETVAGFFQGVWNGITSAFAAVGEFFSGIFSGAWDTIKGIFEGIGGWFEERWKDIKKVFSGISGFFRTVFEGARDAIRTVWNTVTGLVTKPINALIDLLNIFIRGLNKIKVPDWVPAIGGYGIHIPEIPNLETGGILKKGQLGLLEGNGAEAVVPLDQNKKWVSSIVAEMGKQMQGMNTGGDIIIPVNIGQRRIETIVIEAQRLNNYRSGGR